MKLRIWIRAGVLCAICCLGVESSYAQKMYKQGETIVLDCGPGSGFAQGAVEMQKGKKIAVGTPSDTQGPMTNNLHNQSINATIYHKLEIAKEDAPGTMTWANAYLYCKEQGEGWRLPTQRELQMLWIFKSAVTGLGGTTFASATYWSSTENSNSSSWYVNFYSGYPNNSNKTSTFSLRCVREL